MEALRYRALPILLASTWISVSEFARNEFFLKSYWLERYAGLGVPWPGDPINGALWGIWSVCFAVAIFVIRLRFNRVETILLSWWMGFVLMWLVTGNMGVLPLDILVFAIPLSLLETFLAVFILEKMDAR